MPFELKNARATFQRTMNVIRATVNWQYASVYIDDVIIFSPTTGDHIEHIESVIRLISKAGMTTKLKKCPLFLDAIDYLGHVISPGRLHVAIKTKETNCPLKYLTNTTELCTFGYLQRIASLCTEFRQESRAREQNSKRGQPTKFDMDEKGKKVVNLLKHNLINPPVLALTR